MDVLFPKDTEAFCGKCGDLMFVFNCDIPHHSKVLASTIYQDKGQAPWKPLERLTCRKCGNVVIMATMYSHITFKAPGGGTNGKAQENKN